MNPLSKLSGSLLIAFLLAGCSGLDMKADQQGASMKGPGAGSTTSQQSTAGTISTAGQSPAPDNFSAVNEDGSYLTAQSLPGSKIIITDPGIGSSDPTKIIYDGDSDLRLDRGLFQFDPDTGAVLSLELEGFEAVKSEAIRARNQGLAVIADQTKALSADQRAQIEAIAPGLIDGILELAKVAGIP